MFTQLLKAIVSIFCGGLSDDQQQPAYPQTPSQQYPQQHSHSQQVSHPNNTQTHKPPHRHEDLNQINQNNQFYVDLRARANEEGDAMAKCFEQSHEAYNRGDGAEAKALSNRGKEHQRQMESLNMQAANWIYIENNKDSKPGEIDLHGLYVKEAISRTDEAIEAAKRRGDYELHLIVGKGLHSKGGAAKIKPAIEELMQKHRLRAELDPTNAGVLIVQINSRDTERGVNADELVHRIEQKNDGCFIM